MSDLVDFESLKPMSQNAFAKFAGVSAKQASIWKNKGYLHRSHSTTISRTLSQTENMSFPKPSTLGHGITMTNEKGSHQAPFSAFISSRRRRCSGEPRQ